LSRAADIPAREIDGYAYTQNSRERPISLEKDVLHAWPEYYDKNEGTWVMVDPTWENTTGGVDYFHTFDFDHVAFVIKGKDPEYPVPAGGYKLPNQTQQDVTATFADNTIQPSPKGVFSSSLSATALAGFPVDGTVTVVNTGTTLFPSQKVLLASTFSFFPKQDLMSPDIPPFAHVTMPFTLGKAAFLTNQKGTVTMSLAGKDQTYNVAIEPFSESLILIGGITFGCFIITLFIIARRSRRISIP